MNRINFYLFDTDIDKRSFTFYIQEYFEKHTEFLDEFHDNSYFEDDIVVWSNIILENREEFK